MSQQGSRFNQAVAGHRGDTQPKAPIPHYTTEQQALGVSLLLEVSQNTPNIAKVADLIARGAALETFNPRGKTPLLQAAAAGNDIVADMLIQAGANVNVRDEEGSTPLILATIAGNAKTVRHLIEKNADPHALNAHDRTALMWAAALGRREIAQMLIRSGADSEQHNQTGQTAYDIARMHENFSLAEILKAGAQQHKDAGNARPVAQTRGGAAFKDVMGKA